MSKLNKIFTKLPVPVQNRSGFDQSHEHLFTATTGTLIPALCYEVLPNDKVSLGAMTQVKLPPMATDFYGRVDARLEAFFVPNRLLYGGWQSFISGNYDNDDEGRVPVSKVIPQVAIGDVDTHGQVPLLAGSLADYLGIKNSSDVSCMRSALPFLAYHRIWDDWYRDARIQKPAFVEVGSITGGHTAWEKTDPACAPYAKAEADSGFVYGSYNHNDYSIMLADETSLFDLRQRNYGKDYFTVATTKPQFGQESRLSFQVEGGAGSFSIAALRAANSLQKFLERNNIAGNRYIDQIQAQFGCLPADAVMQRPVYLGGATIPIYSKSVFNQNTNTDSPDTKNPYNGFTGSNAGSAAAFGENSLIGDFHATEHGFIMVMFSIVPHAYYTEGVERYLRHTTLGDFAFPLLAGVGDQPIYQDEVNRFKAHVGKDTIFGYSQRYAEYKFMHDKVSGLLRKGENLQSFALQRSVDSPSQAMISDAFLQISVTALEDVLATQSSYDNPAWVDIYFNFKSVRALPVYSLPTLGDEKDVHNVLINNGGTRL